MVGATITLLNSATAAKRMEVSNGQGEYLFSDVAVGRLRSYGHGGGFWNVEVDSLHVDADANVRTDAQSASGVA